jgi:hypothetical protein
MNWLLLAVRMLTWAKALSSAWLLPQPLHVEVRLAEKDVAEELTVKSNV